MVDDLVVAVAAIDISLASTERFLNDHRISPNAISVVLDSQLKSYRLIGRQNQGQ